MAHILTKMDLDGIRCDAPGCRQDHRVIYFRPACHPNGGLDVRYDKDGGYLALLCRECAEVVERIAPAERGAPHQ
jgi:hypothetical protein